MHRAAESEEFNNILRRREHQNNARQRQKKKKLRTNFVKTPIIPHIFIYLFIYLRVFGIGKVQSVERLATGWTVQGSSPSGGREIFSAAEPWRPATAPTQPLIEYRRSFPTVRRPGFEAEHSPPYSAEIKNEWSSVSTYSVGLHGSDRDTFTFYLFVQLQFTYRLFENIRRKC